MRWASVLGLALSVGLCMADNELPCTIHHDGRYYDLNPLKSNQDYEFRTPGDNVFTINVCRRPLKESFGLKDVDDSTVAGFVRLAHGDFSIGTVNTTLSVFDSNVLRLTLTGGSRCKLKPDDADGELRGSAIVDFVCDRSVGGTGDPRLVAQFPLGTDEEACGYFLQWKTRVACPTHEPGRTWGFLAVLIFTLIGLGLLYLLTGTLYNRYVLHLQGFDQIPRFSLDSMRYHVSEAAEWVRDFTGIGSNKYDYRMPEEGLPRGLSQGGNSPPPAGRSGGGGFVVASGKKADINPVSHQAQAASGPQGRSPPSIKRERKDHGAAGVAAQERGRDLGDDGVIRL